MQHQNACCVILPVPWCQIGVSSSATTMLTRLCLQQYGNVIMSAVASQITGIAIVYSSVCSCADQRKYQSSASLAFGKGINRWPVNSPHKGLVTRKMFPFDDVIMNVTWTISRNIYIALQPLSKLCKERSEGRQSVSLLVTKGLFS